MPTLCPVLSCAVCSVIRCSIIYCEGSNKIQVRHITCPGRKNHLPSMPLHSHHIRPPLNKWSPHDYFLLEFGYIIPSRCTHKSCLMLSRRSLLKIVNSSERNRGSGASQLSLLGHRIRRTRYFGTPHFNSIKFSIPSTFNNTLVPLDAFNS